MDTYSGLGVAYYPEHWDPSLWEDDARRMREHGIDTVRIGEFAWGLLEPAEGEFDLGFFDRFVDICHEVGLGVIFGTPTATPPVWMQHDYPEILNCDREGHPFDGPRRNYTYNSPAYRRFSERIVAKLAEHYGPHPAIVGWQIDNELNCEVAEFYSESDHAAFREYLRAKFGTLAELNRGLGTTFWSRIYSDWNQVGLGRKGLYGSVNPHLQLEERRFFSHSAIEFTRMQCDLLRRHLPDDVFITTNGLFPNLDYNALLAAGLDFITFDSYPNFANDVSYFPPNGGLKDRKWSWNLAWTRSISPTFGIMEQQSGAHGWTNRMEAPAPKPGQMRLWTLQSIAHGADFVSYFRWRTSPMGHEIYWHGLNDYANTPNRRLAELRSIASEWDALTTVRGSRYEARIAVVKDYDNQFDAELDIWHGRVARASDDAWFRATQLSHTPCDFLFLGAATLEDLRRYDLLVYPHAAIMSEEVSALLRQYVTGGGTLVFGARTGYKDQTGQCPMRPMPGLVGDWVGVTVSDYTLVRDDRESSLQWGGRRLRTPVFNEILDPHEGTAVLATFTDDYYAGTPALVHRSFGDGGVYYLGSCFSEEAVAAILEAEGLINPYAGVIDLPTNMELAVRSGARGRWLFVLNYADQPGIVRLRAPLVDTLRGAAVEGEVELGPFDVRVFEI